MSLPIGIIKKQNLDPSVREQLKSFPENCQQTVVEKQKLANTNEQVRKNV